MKKGCMVPLISNGYDCWLFLYDIMTKTANTLGIGYTNTRLVESIDSQESRGIFIILKMLCLLDEGTGLL